MTNPFRAVIEWVRGWDWLKYDCGSDGKFICLLSRNTRRMKMLCLLLMAGTLVGCDSLPHEKEWRGASYKGKAIVCRETPVQYPWYECRDVLFPEPK